MKNKNLIKLDVVGLDPAVFDRLFSKLTKTVEEAFSTLANKEISDNKKETINDLASISKNYFQARVQKPSIDNQKLIAEIAKEYAEAEEKMASAHKLRVESESIELENAIKKLRYTAEAIMLLKKLNTFYAGEDNFVIDMSEDNQRNL